MSEFLHYYIIAIVILNIAGCTFLLYATAKPPKVAAKASPNSVKEKEKEKEKEEEEEDATTGHVWDDDLTELNTPLPRWWLWLFYATIIYAGIYLLLYPGMGNFSGLLNWSQIEIHAQEKAALEQRVEKQLERFATADHQALVDQPAAMAMAGNLFAQHCAACHGADASGAAGFPNLTDKDWLYGNSAEQIETSIKNGRNGFMPPFGAALDQSRREALAHYLLSLSQSSSAPAEVLSQGQTLFAQNCFACHGADATGNIALGAPNLSDAIWLYGNSIKSISESIELGRNGAMPAHKDTLSEVEIKLLTAYLLSL